MGNTINLYGKKLTWVDPESVFDTLFAQERDSFWLDSSLTNADNRFSYMGSDPDELYTFFLKDSKQDIFTFLDSKLKRKVCVKTKLPFNFTGGFIGYFGYELKALTEGKKSHISPYPDSLWYLVTKFVAFDHKKKEVYLVSLAKNKQVAEIWFEKINAKVKTVRRNELSPPSILSKAIGKPPKYTFARSKRQYLKDIAACKRFLLNGESYQICLTNTITTKTQTNPLLLYKILRKNNPAPYAAYVKHEELSILCSSPELFLAVDKNRNVTTKPIKGTIRRGATPGEDKKLIKQLARSKKDWSENAMIVDLLRNDLGKICKFGSVKVQKSMEVESYQTLHQLVSTVTGTLLSDVSLIDCVKACFPGGSMTGAPKIRTMEILDTLEKQARGIYSGALGFLSFNQTAELNIVIRTIVAKNNTVSIGAGGAILIDSDPQKEYDEMLLKTKALLESIEQGEYTEHMHTVFLALGSNVGNKKQNIKQALTTLERHLSSIKLAKLYETKPMYYENQDIFINTVIKGQTHLSPSELLAFIKHTERELGRQERFPNGPREIDIDILFYDQLVYESVDLVIPHPRISEREFVLKPFVDIDPDFKHPTSRKSMKELLTKLKQKK